MQLPDGRIRKARRSDSEPAPTHMLTFTCYKGMRLLRAEWTRAWFAEAVAGARAKLEFDVVAFVVMPNHVHLIVYSDRRLPPGIIRREVKRPIATRAICWLRMHSPSHLERLQSGSESRHRFWEDGGGHDRPLMDNHKIARAIRYVHRNPVTAGLVEKAEDWTWSSDRWYRGLGASPIPVDRVLVRLDEPA